MRKPFFMIFKNSSELRPRGPDISDKSDISTSHNELEENSPRYRPREVDSVRPPVYNTDMTTESKTPHAILAHRVEVGNTVVFDGIAAEVVEVHERSGGFLSFDLAGQDERYVLRYATVSILL
jgi:hypothetical protein